MSEKEKADINARTIAGAITTLMIWLAVPLWFINCHQSAIESELRRQNEMLLEMNK
jgi:hypothetical protein